MIKDFIESKDTGWYTYQLICDNCGNRVYSKSITTTMKPEKYHFCINCLRYFIDNGIKQPTKKFLLFNAMLKKVYETKELDNGINY